MIKTIVDHPDLSLKHSTGYWNALKKRALSHLSPIAQEKLPSKSILWPVLTYSRSTKELGFLEAFIQEENESIQNFGAKNFKRILDLLPEMKALLEYEVSPDSERTQGANLKLKDSLLLIQHYWPEAYEETQALCTHVSWFSEPHKFSYSSPKLFGTLFINSSLDRLDEVKLATSIIHETAHHALYIETAVDKLIPNDFSKPVYSPIRGSSRPAIAALHGLMAMARMLIWSKKLELGNEGCQKESSTLKEVFIPKFSEAITAIEKIEFSEKGKIFFESLCRLQKELKL